jgi:hypothetical protein
MAKFQFKLWSADQNQNDEYVCFDAGTIEAEDQPVAKTEGD